MERKVKHIRLPENLEDKVKKYQEENYINTFTQALVTILNEYFSKRRK